MIENNSTKGNGETGPNPKDRSDRLPNDAYPSYRIFDSASDGIIPMPPLATLLTLTLSFANCSAFPATKL